MGVRFLSNQELDLNLKRLVVSERKILNVILEHVVEVEKRKMYLEKAYASTYDYLTKELGYSGSAAMRRLSAARLLKEVPEVADEINSGNINLSQITELSRAIKEKEKTGAKVSTLKKQELVTAIAGKNTAESQKEIAKALDIDLKPPERTSVQKDDSVHLQLTLSKAQHEKLLKCRDLLSNKLLSENSDTSLAAVIDLLSDNYLSKVNKAVHKNAKGDSELTTSQPNENCTSRDAELIPDLALKTDSVQDSYSNSNSSSNSNLNSSASPDSKSNSKSNSDSRTTAQCRTKETVNKTLTPKTRITVLSRDQHCQYRDPRSGRICGTKFNLTVDHIQPQWAAGDHSLGNLQTLCQGHNNLKYRDEANIKLF